MFRGACWHAQQAVEKGLKALLIDAIVFLNSVYRGRCPTDEGLLPHGDPTRDEASTAVSGADRLVAFLRLTLAGQG